MLKILVRIFVWKQWKMRYKGDDEVSATAAADSGRWWPWTSEAAPAVLHLLLHALHCRTTLQCTAVKHSSTELYCILLTHDAVQLYMFHGCQCSLCTFYQIEEVFRSILKCMLSNPYFGNRAEPPPQQKSNDNDNTKCSKAKCHQCKVFTSLRCTIRLASLRTT